MEKQEFKNLTEQLIRWSPRLDRFVLKPEATRTQCRYCGLTVENQRIICEGYRVGRKDQHLKHRCLTCRIWLFDGSKKTVLDEIAK